RTCEDPARAPTRLSPIGGLFRRIRARENHFEYHGRLTRAAGRSRQPHLRALSLLQLLPFWTPSIADGLDHRSSLQQFGSPARFAGRERLCGDSIAAGHLLYFRGSRRTPFAE